MLIGTLALINRREFLRLTSALAVVAGRGQSAGFTLARKPYLQSVLTDRASLLWTTRESGTGAATLTAAGQTRTVTASRRTFTPADTRLTYTFYQYQADFVGLTPNTPYAYTISVGGQNLASDSFRTADTSSKFSFLAFGDSGEDTPEQQTLINLMQAEQNIAMVIHTGDLSYPQGDYVQYEDSYFGKNAGLMRRLCFFPTPGNHDNVYNLVPYLNVHSLPKSPVPAGDEGQYYSFDWGNVHFATVNTNALGSSISDRMLDWLDDDLHATQKFWRIVVYHHASYPTGHHLGDPFCELARELINPIGEQRNAQLMLAGHEHGYERTVPLVGDIEVRPGQGTTYVITGGGGADLHDVSEQPQTALALSIFHYTRVDIDGGTLTLRAIGLDGGEIDRIVLKPRPILTGISSAADFTSGIASGSLISLFGRNLGSETVANLKFPLPTQSAGVTVQIGGEYAPVLFASPSQINCQVPFDLTGNETVLLTTPNGSDSSRINVAEVAPAILTVTYADRVVSSSNPVPPGAVAVAYMTGLGKVAGTIAAGEASTSASNTVLATVDVTVSGIHPVPIFAGLAPGFAGLYQVNFVVPNTVNEGANTLQVSADGVNSRSYSLFVKL